MLDLIIDNWAFTKWIISGIFGAGAAWTVLYMKDRTLALQIERLEQETSAHDAAVDERINLISRDLNEHKHETTDRLARIETKLDGLIELFRQH